MPGEAKRNYSPRPKVGTIECPAGHEGEIRKQTNGKLFVYCEFCKTKFTYDGAGGQDFLLENGNFDNKEKSTTEETTVKTVKVNVESDTTEKQQPKPSEKKEPGFFDDDEDFGF